MDQNISRLSCLMDALNVNGRELSKAISVDYSLVSKWRTKKRQLTRRSAHIQRIADYLIATDKASGGATIRRILTGDNDAAMPSGGIETRDLLIHWLTAEDKINPCQKIFALQPAKNGNRLTTDCNTYRGNAERRTAVLQFLDYALDLPEGQQLLLISQEDTTWMTEDPDFIKLWQSKLVGLLNKNHHIKIIHWIDRKTDQLAEMMIKWLPLHLTGRIDALYYPRYDVPLFKMTLFIIQQHLVLFGMDDYSPDMPRYTALLNDPISCKHYESLYMQIHDKCNPLVETCVLPDTARFMERIYENRSSYQSIFLVSRLFQYSTMRQDIFEDLIRSLNLSSKGEKACRIYYERSHANFDPAIRRYRAKHLYDLHTLEQAAAGEICPFQELSIAASTKFEIPREILMRHINYLIELLESNDSFEIGLINFRQSKMPVPTNLWIEQSNYVLAWAPEISRILAMSSEATLVNAFNYYYDNLWESIPKINRSREHVINELTKLTRI